MKNCLPKNLQVKLQFEDLLLDKTQTNRNIIGMKSTIEHYIFHPCVNANTFQRDFFISFFPPKGEFTLMQYRLSKYFNLPFRLICETDELSENKILFRFKVYLFFFFKYN